MKYSVAAEEVKSNYNFPPPPPPFLIINVLVFLLSSACCSFAESDLLFFIIKKWNCMRNTAISAAFVNCLKVWVNAHPGQLCCIHNNLKVSLDTHRDQFCSTHNCVKDWLDRHHDLFRYFHSSGNVWLDVHWDYFNCITLYQQSENRSESGPCPVLLYSWQKLRALFATSDRIASPNKVTRVAVKGHFGMRTYQSNLCIFYVTATLQPTISLSSSSTAGCNPF